jgi:TPR repeat protein
LGYLLQYGKGTPKDLNAAAKYYQMAADFGHAEGLYRLATLTQTGDGVAVDVVRCLNFTTAFRFRFACLASLSSSRNVTRSAGLQSCAQGLRRRGMLQHSKQKPSGFLITLLFAFY